MLPVSTIKHVNKHKNFLHNVWPLKATYFQYIKTTLEIELLHHSIYLIVFDKGEI